MTVIMKQKIVFIIIVVIAGGVFIYSSRNALFPPAKVNLPQNSNQPILSDPWEDIKQAIAECRVEDVSQLHSLKVSARLKDGTTLSATEPGIDNILNLAEAAEPRCGSIIMMTE